MHEISQSAGLLISLLVYRIVCHIDKRMPALVQTAEEDRILMTNIPKGWRGGVRKRQEMLCTRNIGDRPTSAVIVISARVSGDTICNMVSEGVDCGTG